MNINDAHFSGLGDSKRIAQYLADVKGIAKKRPWADDQNYIFWKSIPRITANAKRGDVVKDYSIDNFGTAGVVVDVATKNKRDGRTATVITIAFAGHTDKYRTVRHRKLEFINEQ
jgi:hypothetical protein